MTSNVFDCSLILIYVDFQINNQFFRVFVQRQIAYLVFSLIIFVPFQTCYIQESFIVLAATVLK